MRPLFWIGVVLAASGLISLFVPIPHSEHEGFSIAGMSIGIEAQSRQTVSPIISAVLILGGVSLMIAGKSGI